MPRLIHLNGPPGIGKSTLSAIYVERHPGVLNLDIDTLHRLVGGWRDTEGRTHDILRPVALAMASTHLAGGRDVVLPQYLGRLDAVAAFERAAVAAGAEFREVVLLDERADAIARFHARTDDTPWGVHVREQVAAMGGTTALATMYDRLLEVMENRPGALVVRSQLGAVERTYDALVEALEGVEPTPPATDAGDAGGGHTG